MSPNIIVFFLKTQLIPFPNDNNYGFCIRYTSINRRNNKLVFVPAYCTIDAGTQMERIVSVKLKCYGNYL